MQVNMQRLGEDGKSPPQRGSVLSHVSQLTLKTDGVNKKNEEESLLIVPLRHFNHNWTEIQQVH